MPDLIVTDNHMPGANGFDVVAWARARGVSCPFVILTASADEETLAAAGRHGRTTVSSKPQPLDRIQQAAAGALSAGV